MHWLLFSYYLYLDFFENSIEKSESLKCNTMNFIEINSSKNFK